MPASNLTLNGVEYRQLGTPTRGELIRQATASTPLDKRQLVVRYTEDLRNLSVRNNFLMRANALSAAGAPAGTPTLLPWQLSVTLSSHILHDPSDLHEMVNQGFEGLICLLLGAHNSNTLTLSVDGGASVATAIDLSTLGAFRRGEM